MPKSAEIESGPPPPYTGCVPEGDPASGFDALHGAENELPEPRPRNTSLSLEQIVDESRLIMEDGF